MTAPEAGTRTLVVHCPHWPVVAAGAEPGAAVIVVRANRVLAASPAARAAGVAVGLRRRQAQQRCPHVTVVDHDPARDARAFEPLASSLDAVTPGVEVTRPGTLAFATRGPSRYFGGDGALAERVAWMAAGALGEPVEMHVGVADGAFAALLAAQRAHREQVATWVVSPGESAGFLAPQPVGALAEPLDDAELTDGWRRLGLATLGHLADLERADLLARFGRSGLAGHRLASGLDLHPLDARRPAPDLAATAEIDPPADRIDRVAFTAKVLADELHARLGADGLACTQVRVEAETEHGEHLSRCWRHEGALTAGALADRVRWQLDGWLASGTGGTEREQPGQLDPLVRPGGPGQVREETAAARASSHAPARLSSGSGTVRPTAGICRLTLVPVEVVAARGRQLGFWGGETLVDERIWRAVARVQGQLGVDAVTVPEVRGGRGPAERVVRVPVVTVDLTEARTATQLDAITEPWPGRVPSPSPATVWADPEPVEVVDAAGAAVTVSGRAEVSASPARLTRLGRPAVTLSGWTGPWPVDERWWDPARHRRRARFQVVEASGLAHLLAVEAGRWWLEATYD